jgi:hypothetical protein
MNEGDPTDDLVGSLQRSGEEAFLTLGNVPPPLSARAQALGPPSAVPSFRFLWTQGRG